LNCKLNFGASEIRFDLNRKIKGVNIRYLTALRQNLAWNWQEAIRVEKYKNVDRDENRHTFLKLLARIFTDTGSDEDYSSYLQWQQRIKQPTKYFRQSELTWQSTKNLYNYCHLRFVTASRKNSLTLNYFHLLYDIIALYR